MNLLLIAITALGFIADVATPDFSGIWKQSNERSLPKRTGEVTLRISQRVQELTVETTSKGLITRHAVQHYTTDGVESKSIGADGDEFHSTVVWRDGTLAFEILELEDGKRLRSTEFWSLIDEGMSLKRVRKTEKNGEQTVIYIRAEQVPPA
jgi:hypothetical protein